jgi:GAF domain-containing protein
MPYVACPRCDLLTYCVREDDCPRCGARVLADPVGHALPRARAQLHAGAAAVSEIAGGRERIRHVAGAGRFPGVVPGAAVPLDETVCARVLAGRVAPVIPDIPAEEALADLEGPRAAGVQAYLGVPFRSADARLYVLCCLWAERRPELGEADLRFLQGLADSLREPLATTAP